MSCIRKHVLLWPLLFDGKIPRVGYKPYSQRHGDGTGYSPRCGGTYEGNGASSGIGYGRGDGGHADYGGPEGNGIGLGSGDMKGGGGRGE